MIDLPFGKPHRAVIKDREGGLVDFDVPGPSSAVGQTMRPGRYDTPERTADGHYRVSTMDPIFEHLHTASRGMSLEQALSRLLKEGLSCGIGPGAADERMAAVKGMVTAAVHPEVMELLHREPGLQAILDDPKLDAQQRKALAAPIIARERGRIRGEIMSRDKTVGQLRDLQACMREFLEWADSGKPAVLERNDCSRLHHLLEATKTGRAFLADGTPMMLNPQYAIFPWEDLQTFVVEHDWARAFEGAGDFSEGGFKLPYVSCAFEFRINGRTVIVLAGHDGGVESEPIVLVPWVECAGCWFAPEDGRVYFNEVGAVHGTSGALTLAAAQIRAISIALDAEVATHAVTRAPHKLNAKRAAHGKLPLYDYHVVSLARRTRALGTPPSSGLVSARKRLHFRRGHWRHYAAFKTWVRWTLVGDPELGFIDKEYRL